MNSFFVLRAIFYNLLCLFIKHSCYHRLENKIHIVVLPCIYTFTSIHRNVVKVFVHVSKCKFSLPMQSISVHGNSSLGLCFYQSLETWQIVPGSSCSLSCDIFSSWTEISSSPDTWTPLTFRENSHSFLHPVQCRSRGSASDVNWKTSCFLGIFIAAIKATSARTNFKCLQIDFLKEFTLLGVISCAFSCKMKETIDLPWATENEIEKKRKEKVKHHHM